MKRPITSQIRRGLVVSCQLDRSEPLHTPQHCALFAQAATMGGAVGIRADGLENIKEIRATVRLPIIGCIRTSYSDDIPLSTPRLEDVEALIRVGADIVAIDGTARQRPGMMVTGTDMIGEVRHRFPSAHIMADISSVEEARSAAEKGADAVSTVMFGRTAATFESAGVFENNLELIETIAAELPTPIFAEGFVWSPEEGRRAIEAGAYGVIVGGAITRPRILTRLFGGAIDDGLRPAPTEATEAAGNA